MAAPASSADVAAQIPNVAHGDRSLEKILPAARDRMIAIRVIELLQGKVDRVPMEDLFVADGVRFSDPIVDLEGLPAVKARFEVWARLFEPDVAPDHAASEATELLSVQPVSDLSMKIIMRKRFRLRVFPKGAASQPTVSKGEAQADSSGFEHFVYSTTMRIELDPETHKIRSLKDEWDIGALPALDPSSLASVGPVWVKEFAAEMRPIIIEGMRR